ncbi:MAG: TetR/AcrR family transcriptional regulator, partial [Thermoplasmata archaeon]|nr:TetR/AcrR family transcriptional regulator [Thermoplasmata archaeon]
MSPRRYDLGRRREASEATGARILEATRALLGGKGDPAEFSMEAVAAKAGVSRMTVYNRFRSEGQLLEALADHLASKGGMVRLREAFMEPVPEEAVRTFVATFVGFWASDRVLLRRLRALGVSHPALYRGLRERDGWRREAARNLIAKLGAAAPRRDAASVEGAVDLLTSLTSFETFDGLCTESRGPDEVARLLSDTVV